eukprot:CCRYP_007420-RA/>CCRYP_007420-RA protein AED:0.40 eAED:0.42 QI:0/0/0/1/1/1/2/0/261
MTKPESATTAATDGRLTADEAKQFERAFQDESFRKLLADYASELSDPKHRAEQEAYIKQLEEQNELPSGKELIRPSAGFVVKCTHRKMREKHDSKTKLFLNMVHSEKVPKPMPTKKCRKAKENSPMAFGTNWSVPFALGPLRMEADKSGKHLVPTFDCCFHPLSLQYAHGSKSFRDFIIEVAKDAVTRSFEASSDPLVIYHEYTILRGVSYKNGTPKALMVASVLSNTGDDSDSIMKSGNRNKWAKIRGAHSKNKPMPSNS